MPTSDLSMLGKAAWMLRGSSKDSASMSRCLKKRRMIEDADESSSGDKNDFSRTKWPSWPNSTPGSLMLTSRFSDTSSDGKSEDLDATSARSPWATPSSSDSESNLSGSSHFLRPQAFGQSPFGGGIQSAWRDESRRSSGSAPNENCCPEFRQHSFWG